MIGGKASISTIFRLTMIKLIPIDVPELLRKFSFQKVSYFESVSAGFPSPADDYLEQSLDINKFLITNPSTTFFAKVDGRSMIGAGIYPGDILIVDRSKSVKNKDVIIALIEGDFTVKRFVKKQNRCFLRPENKHYPTIEVTDRNDFEVWGVVIKVLHDPIEL